MKCSPNRHLFDPTKKWSLMHPTFRPVTALFMVSAPKVIPSRNMGKLCIHNWHTDIQTILPKLYALPCMPWNTSQCEALEEWPLIGCRRMAELRWKYSASCSLSAVTVHMHGRKHSRTNTGLVLVLTLLHTLCVILGKLLDFLMLQLLYLRNGDNTSPQIPHLQDSWFWILTP